MIYSLDYFLLGILLIPGLIFAAIAQYRVSHTFSKYKEYSSETGRPAHEVARMFLDYAGLQDVQIIMDQNNIMKN